MVAEGQIGAASYPVAWLLYQHGFRWDDDGHWSRVPSQPDLAARLRADDLVVVDEAGMLDQDTARALLAFAAETGVRVGLVGDRHQLPAVGRGGVLDLAARHAADRTLTLEGVRRFADPAYADLSLRMRRAEQPGEVFDELARRGEIVVHASEVERQQALAVRASLGELVVADTREQVGRINGLAHRVRDHHRRSHRRCHDQGRGADRHRRSDRDPPQRPRHRRRQPRDLDRHRRPARRPDRRRRGRPTHLASRLRARARRARLRHHRLRRPRHHRPHLTCVGRRPHRRLLGLRRDDPRSRDTTPPTSSPTPSTTPDGNGSTSSAATAPTSDPPTPHDLPQRPSTATGRKPSGQPDGRRLRPVASKTTSATAHRRRRKVRASASEAIVRRIVSATCHT